MSESKAAKAYRADLAIYEELAKARRAEVARFNEIVKLHNSKLSVIDEKLAAVRARIGKRSLPKLKEI